MSEYYKNEENSFYNKEDGSKKEQKGLNLLPGSPKKDHILHKYAKEKNLVKFIDEEDLQKISGRVQAGFEEDKKSQAIWLKDVEEAQRLAKLAKEPKNTPLPNSANIKFPLITQACYQFAARTYPEIVNGGKVVKTEVIGRSDLLLQRKAERISDHMSYQLLCLDTEWEAGMDRLLPLYANVGFICKKTYYEPIKKRNRSIVCNYKDLVLRNSKDINTLADLERITHVLYVRPNDLVEGCRADIYDEDAVDKILNLFTEGVIDPVITLQEQHRFLDLDNDGYAEPYIVTRHEQTGTVIRIVARYTEDDIELEGKKVLKINPIQYFTDYHFLPSLDGSFMSVGFGVLMLHLNETVNSILNQLVDAGSLANMQTGFIDSRIKIMGGQLTADPGQWNRVKSVASIPLKEGIVPINYKEPSTVLFQLLGLLIESAKDLTASTDALQGSMNATNVPATSMLAMIEQGMKMFSAIQKRLYRSLKDEYQKLYRLNQLYLDPEEYNALVGDPMGITVDDYRDKSIKIVPLADPNISSDAQRMAQSQLLITLIEQKIGIDIPEAVRRILDAAKIPNAELLLPPPMPAPPPPPELIKIEKDHDIKQQSLAIKAAGMDLKQKEFAVKLAKAEADITKVQAETVRTAAEAHAIHRGSNLDEAQLHLAAAKHQVQVATQGHQAAVDNNIREKQLFLQAQDQAQRQAANAARLQLEQTQPIREVPADEFNQGSNPSMGTPPSDNGDA